MDVQRVENSGPIFLASILEKLYQKTKIQKDKKNKEKKKILFIVQTRYC